ncbi:MAG TPA: glycine dehydrogenase (aminomethyl-transferring) [Cytophagales bacterium]|jgi:glycine dehydrogenase|nr:glycine dehydrogenase (aminomethyl-transferring) [Cytophagales bacterium]
MKIDLRYNHAFERRHNGPREEGVKKMLETIGVSSLDELIDQTVPESIRLKEPLMLPRAKSEHNFLNELKQLASGNKVNKSYIGLGYYGTVTPGVIQRNILENPGWYTAYTPYQAEIAQGRLEALLNYQTMVTDLTGLELANASLLDESTAAAEAMSMLHGSRKGAKKSANKFFVDENAYPQTLDVLNTRAVPIGLELVVGQWEKFDVTDPEFFGVLLQYPDANGEVKNIEPFIASAKENDLFVAVAADLMSLVLLTPPGEMGADVVCGTTQRFGVPMGYGGPHAAYFATREQFKRQIPGRIIGVSIDKTGKKAYRMALQTREQHIKRERATSNICTAQVLLAVMAGMYALYHGPDRLKKTASKIHGLSRLLEKVLRELGYAQVNAHYFDTLKVDSGSTENAQKIKAIAESKGINFRYFGDQYIGISLDETCELEEVNEIADVFAEQLGKTTRGIDLESLAADIELNYPRGIQRESVFLGHPIFHQFHSEHEMLRYIKRLENKDLSLVHSMISLGSCTMKLNASAEMQAITWPEFALIHPFAPADQTKGYQTLIHNLEAWLNEITGFAATSLQPNSGAQGEFSGLMVISAYHEANGDGHRNIALIPSSAHGTNPASAVMAGMKVVIVNCDDHGNIDIEDLREKSENYKDNLAALMVTYPSTHGVFEEGIKEVCDIIHKHGGQVYMDGANMNAQVGLTTPARIGADVCHLNLHKTFTIPHGGGGPGVGPICVVEHLKPFLPGNPFIKTGGEKALTAVSAAPFGSASILPISYAYISMMGPDGLTNATKIAILNANYIKSRLKGAFDILYTGKNDRCAHEMILDCRPFKQHGIEVEDIAKRLMDYGFHAPTVSFPVPGTLMVEPTESESIAELDRFCEAMLTIRTEIQEIENGEVDADQNVLKNAPHTAEVINADDWDYPYTREKAAYPLPWVRDRKFWTSVSRIDNAYGDRNLVCSCLPVSEYEEEEITAEA